MTFRSQQRNYILKHKDDKLEKKWLDLQISKLEYRSRRMTHLFALIFIVGFLFIVMVSIYFSTPKELSRHS
ncbi:hypothetical protein PCK1_000935 [Pneumocystis canis]|nr:hypothetical protein PCK1_000935 [Pneumocystis canis]